MTRLVIVLWVVLGLTTAPAVSACLVESMTQDATACCATAHGDAASGCGMLGCDPAVASGAVDEAAIPSPGRPYLSLVRAPRAPVGDVPGQAMFHTRCSHDRTDSAFHAPPEARYLLDCAFRI